MGTQCYHLKMDYFPISVLPEDFLFFFSLDATTEPSVTLHLTASTGTQTCLHDFNLSQSDIHEMSRGVIFDKSPGTRVSGFQASLL